ncbi:Ig-like domain-containing protein [Parabacteroides sp. PFB2-10]|uniref:Ig-like domain-containing protein n=1 Tax=Parabacteroides sp. PFB2-10 TaxID=1742405 RepID=UPI002475C2B2|nr:Ig-like domain-containing protein [Parabacteroides sp. PFB2-10]
MVSGVSLDYTTLSMLIGESHILKATITPEDATNNSVSWTSSDEAVATVDESGEVKAIAMGSATITTTALDGGKTATCEVTVGDPANGNLVVYDSPGDLKGVEHLSQSDKFKLEVRRANSSKFIESFVYMTDNYWVDTYFKGEPRKQTHASFSHFSFEDTEVEVRITSQIPVNSVKIHPLNYHIEPTVDGDQITFRMKTQQKISVEVNDRLHPLFLFTDKPEEPNAEATYYYGSGIHNIGKQKQLNSNESVYIAGGAVVEGSFLINRGAGNVKIQGRGVLSMGEWPHTTTDYLYLRTVASIYSAGTKSAKIEGITITNSCGYTIALNNDHGINENNEFRNLNIVCWNGNTDGIWVNGKNITVEDCFIFNNDDIFMSHNLNGAKIKNIVCWGGPWGRLYWGGAYGDVKGLVMENVEMIGKESGVELFLVNASDRTTALENMTFRNIRIADAPRVSSYAKQMFVNINSGSHRISNWTFENVTVDILNPEGGRINATIEPIKNIVFTNVSVGGKRLTSAADGNITVSGNATVTFK